MRCLKRCQSLHGLPVFAEVCKFVEIKITMEKKVSADAMILQNRTAFALYLKKGLGEVERLYLTREIRSATSRQILERSNAIINRNAECSKRKVDSCFREISVECCDVFAVWQQVKCSLPPKAVILPKFSSLFCSHQLNH